MNAIAIPTRLDNAALLSLKIVAFLWMLGDHIDYGLFESALGFHATLGRSVFPLFAVVLGLNLARSYDGSAMIRRVVPRLLLFGALAMPAYVYVVGWYPLNVMFTLAAALVAVECVQRGKFLVAIALVFVLGVLVDYGVLGVLAVLGTWTVARLGVQPVWVALVAAVIVVPFNGSLWSLVAVPLVWGASHLAGDAPRLKWLFWAGYPLHLIVLAIIKAIA